MNGKSLTYSVMRNYRLLIAKSIVLLSSVLVIYYNDLSVSFERALDFNAGNMTNYVLVIPLLILFILYRKRKILLTAATWQERGRRSVRLDDIVGATLCLIAILVFMFGTTELYSLEYHILSLPVFVAGAIMLLFNFSTLRHLFFVLVLLAYIQPPPGELVSELAADLSWGSAVIVQNILGVVGMPITLDASFGAPSLVVEDSNGIRTPFFVGEPSSGAYSTIGLSMFSLFVAYIIRGTIWKRILVFASGFPIFFILNTLRIAIIISLWYTSGENVAESFHVVSGSVMVAIGTIVLLLFAEKILKLPVRGVIGKKIMQRCPACEKSLAMSEALCLFCGRLLRPLVQRFDAQSIGRIVLIILIASSVIMSQASTSDRNEASALPILSSLDISTIDGPETTEYFFPQTDGWNVRYAYRDSRIEQVLNQDASLAYRFTASDSGSNGTTTAKPSGFVGIQISRGVHTWEGSLLITPSIFGRPTAESIERKDIDLSEDRVGRLFIYKKPGSNLTEAVLYWFEKLELRFGSTFEPRNVGIAIWANADGLARTGVINSPTDVQGIEKVLVSFAQPVSSFWKEISIDAARTRTIDALIGDQIYASLAAVVIPASLISARIYQKDNLLHRLNRKLYQQLSVGEERLLIDAISKMSSREKHTGEAIARHYESSTGRAITLPKLFDLLTQVRDAGLIRVRLHSDGDSPLLTWKQNFVTDRGERVNG